jgi:hypothetical protein
MAVRKGEAIPSFCGLFDGFALDIGAQAAGTAPMVFGVKARFVPPPAARN